MQGSGDSEGGFVGGNGSQAVEISEPEGQGSLERGQSFGAVSGVTVRGWGRLIPKMMLPSSSRRRNSPSSTSAIQMDSPGHEGKNAGWMSPAPNLLCSSPPPQKSCFSTHPHPGHKPCYLTVTRATNFSRPEGVKLGTGVG